MTVGEEESLFDVGVIVRAKLPASDAGDALGKLSQFIRAGIGPDLDGQPRQWETSIASGYAAAGNDKQFRINEQLLHDLETEAGNRRECSSCGRWVEMRGGVWHHALDTAHAAAMDADHEPKPKSSAA